MFYKGPKIPGKLGKAIPSLIGIASIPFIIHPIDNGTDYNLDKFVRPYYPVNIGSTKNH